VALIFCFETLLFFSFVPFLIALARPEGKRAGALAIEVVRRIAFHPLLIATALGVISAVAQFEPPVALDRLMQFLQSAAAPCALFTLGVTVALRPFRRPPWEVPVLLAIKLGLHPLVTLLLLGAVGPFEPIWVATAVLMATLPPALNVFVLARQYSAWVQPASGSVLLGTLISVATVTSVMWLVRHAYMPE
jgi:predicted permease